jgi:two-component system cell cycle sensor histidine kinase/response regulator CckA
VTVTSHDIVLLVEDDEDVRTIVVMALERAGYTALEAGSRAEACRLAARAGHLDLLLTDVALTDGVGTDLYHELCAARPDLPVVFMSGDMDDRVTERIGSESHAGFVAKPFALTDLLATVRSTLALTRRAAAMAHAPAARIAA